MDAGSLKMIAAVLSLVGASLLAWRVKGILEALSLVAKAHEYNIQQLMRPSGDIVHVANSTAHVEKSKQYGMLVLGFTCMIASAVLQLACQLFFP